jgi:hypothetical protein
MIWEKYAIDIDKTICFVIKTKRGFVSVSKPLSFLEEKMGEQVGYSIQCPGCFEWADFELSLEDRVFENINELNGFLSKVDTSTVNDKIFKCHSEDWACPAPFQAVIYKGPFLKREDIIIPNSWMDPYTFRLRSKKNHVDYVGGYHVVLFCTHKIKRLPDIQLEHLLDLDLLSKAIHGICAHVNGPVTIYAARVLDGVGGVKLPGNWLSSDTYKDKVCWLPVETYNDNNKNPLLPQHYNPYCAAKRQIFYEHITETSSINWSKQKDLNLQLGFLLERWKCDSCYWSDWNAIAKIRNAWNKNKSKETHVYKCTSSFCERAIPIIVHDHLVGVAFTGQTFDKEHVVNGLNPEKDLGFIGKYISEQKINMAQEMDNIRCKDYERYIKSAEEGGRKALKQLNEAKRSLFGSERGKFNLDSARLDKRAGTLRENVEKIQKIANTRYLHLRTMTESFFRREILQTIRKEYHEKEKKQCVENVLNRMREFWIFEAAVAIHFHYDEKEKELRQKFYTSPATMTKKGSLNTNEGHQGAIQTWLEHPYPFHYLYKPEETMGMPPLVDSLMKKFEGFKLCADKKEYTMKDHSKKLFVAIPVYTEIWLFIFIERDKSATSPLRAECYVSSISPLCQESMRETCIEVAHEFVKADMGLELKKRLARQQKELQDDQLTQNKIGSEINAPTIPSGPIEIREIKTKTAKVAQFVTSLMGRAWRHISRKPPQRLSGD